MISWFEDNKCRTTKYFCRVDNTLYSFEFDRVYKYNIHICEAAYDKNNSILTFSSMNTFGIPENESDEIVMRRCRRGVRAALLDYQHYHYDENGKLLCADDYKRIYDFSPQIVGLKLGTRWDFVYDETDNIIDAEFNDGIVPCVFGQSGDGSKPLKK